MTIDEKRCISRMLSRFSAQLTNMRVAIREDDFEYMDYALRSTNDLIYETFGLLGHLCPERIIRDGATREVPSFEELPDDWVDDFKAAYESLGVITGTLQNWKIKGVTVNTPTFVRPDYGWFYARSAMREELRMKDTCYNLWCLGAGQVWGVPCNTNADFRRYNSAINEALLYSQKPESYTKAMNTQDCSAYTEFCQREEEFLSEGYITCEDMLNFTPGIYQLFRQRYANYWRVCVAFYSGMVPEINIAVPDFDHAEWFAQHVHDYNPQYGVKLFKMAKEFTRIGYIPWQYNPWGIAKCAKE